MARILAWLASIVVTTGLATNSIFAGEIITDSKFGFTLKVPDGFKSYSELANPKRNILYLFGVDGDSVWPANTVIVIRDMNGLLPQKSTTREDLPASFSGQLYTVTWQGFQVESTTVPESNAKRKTLTINTQIPLRNGAIIVSICGLAHHEKELKKLQVELLSGLSGETNWSAISAQDLTVTRDDAGNAALFMGAVFLITMAVFFSISRTQPRFVVLVAGLFLALGFLIPSQSNNRATLFLTAILRLTGFFGLIMGILESFSHDRRRKAEQKAEIVPLVAVSNVKN